MKLSNRKIKHIRRRAPDHSPEEIARDLRIPIKDVRNRARIYALSILAALMVVFLVYARTKAAWVALFAELILFAGLLTRDYLRTHDFPYWNRDKSIAAAVAIGIVLVMTNLGPRGFEWGFGRIVDQAAIIVKQDGSPEEQRTAYGSRGLRTAIWRNTLEMIRDNPLVGVGLGNHKVFYPLYHRRAVTEKIFSEKAQLTHVHNDFLQAFAELGVVGMLLLGWLLYVIVGVASRLTSPAQPCQVRLWTMGICVSVAGLLVNACFSFPFQRAIPPLVLMSLVAMLGVFHGGEKSGSYLLRRRWIMAVVGVVAIAALVWQIRFHYLAIRSEHHFLNVTRLEKTRSWERIVSEAGKAYGYNPHRAIILSYMGRAYAELGRYSEAIEALEKVVAAYPNHINALLNIGVAYTGIGQEDRAMEAYQKIMSIKPDYAKVHNNTANLLMKQSDFDGRSDAATNRRRSRPGLPGSRP